MATSAGARKDGREPLVEPRGHASLVGGLVRSAGEGALPHALLFTGPEGIGKFQSARWFAAARLCDEVGSAPCGVCGPCRRVISGSHADLLVVDRERHGQDTLSIHFVTRRDPRPKDAFDGTPIEEFLDLRAAEGRGKYVIVRDAGAMNEEAQNAFLKTLEEPRDGVHLILVEASASALLGTVQSRVVPVEFEAPGPELCAAILRDLAASEGGPDLGDDAIDSLTRMGGGAPGRALLLHRRAAPAMAAVIAEALAGERSGADAVAELFDLPGDFPGKTPTAERRSRARMILDLGLDLVADLERAAAGWPADSLPMGDLAEGILGAGAGREPAARRTVAERWLRAREDLELNLSPEGLVERALLASLAPLTTAR